MLGAAVWEPFTQVTLQVTQSKLQGPKGTGVPLAADPFTPEPAGPSLGPSGPWQGRALRASGS